MSDRRPLTRAEELDGLDPDEMIDGYRDGRAGEPEPGDNRSLAFWHGWRNGRSDREGTSDAAQRAFARDLVSRPTHPPGADQ